MQLPAMWRDDEQAPNRLVIGIGEMVVTTERGSRISTHAVGSCIAVCICDPHAGVAGMLHFLLPEASINPDRASAHPAAFADTGIPLLFQKAYGLGLVKQRAVVKLVGGADMAQTSGAFNTGRRNLLAARNLLWRNGVFITAEDVGGTGARTVHMAVDDGRLQVLSGHSQKEL
ncbi:MAG: chemotaxis protein CheD [Cyanobacteria bacterium]|nr:chemotaxis protein CheD [Cyanobacteriota bacterium]